MVAYSSILAWENPIERRAWQATVHGVIKSDTTERLTLTFNNARHLCCLELKQNPGTELRSWGKNPGFRINQRTGT